VTETPTPTSTQTQTPPPTNTPTHTVTPEAPASTPTTTPLPDLSSLIRGLFDGTGEDLNGDGQVSAADITCLLLGEQCHGEAGPLTQPLSLENSCSAQRSS
jgi:hypothetical protein